MKTKHIAGILIGACFAAVIAAAQGDIRQPAAGSGTGAILVGGCSTLGGPGGTFIVALGGTDGSCTMTGAPLHGVPATGKSHIGNLQVTGGYGASAEAGSVVTVYVNGSPTAVTCTVGSGGTCSDHTHRAVVNAGDEMSAAFTAPDASDEMIMSFEVR